MRRLILSTTLALICVGLYADVYTDDAVYRVYYSAVVQGWVANEIQAAVDEVVETSDFEAFFKRVLDLANFLAARSNASYAYLQGVTLALGITMADLTERLQEESR